MVKWRNWGPRIGALLLAFFLWLYAVTERGYSTEIQARLLVHDPPATPGAREVMVASRTPDHVRIRVRGRGKDLLRLYEGSYTVHLRPDGDAGTTRTYRLSEDMVEMREELRGTVEQIVEPRQLEVSLDWRLQRLVPVQARVQVIPAEAHLLAGPLEVEPELVTLSGPSAQVRASQRVQTDSLAVVDADQDVELQVALVVPNCHRCRIDPPAVQVRGDVQLLAQDDLTGVPVAMRGVASRGLRPEPPRVRVRVKGGIDAISGLQAGDDLGLFVEVRGEVGEPLPVHWDPRPGYVVIDVTPAYVTVVER